MIGGIIIGLLVKWRICHILRGSDPFGRIPAAEEIEQKPTVTQLADQDLSRIKSGLLARIDEWVGVNVPSEGSEDHDMWMQMNQEAEDSSSVEDILKCTFVRDPIEFLVNYGVNPFDYEVPIDRIKRADLEELAPDLLASRHDGGGGGSAVRWRRLLTIGRQGSGQGSLECP